MQDGKPVTLAQRFLKIGEPFTAEAGARADISGPPLLRAILFRDRDTGQIHSSP
jgi:hypothetical protein